LATIVQALRSLEPYFETLERHWQFLEALERHGGRPEPVQVSPPRFETLAAAATEHMATIWDEFVPGWQVIVDHLTVADMAKRKGGAPARAIPPAILVKVGAWLAAEGVPETLAEIERKIHDLLAADNQSAGETTVRRWAGVLRDEHRRALHEGS
jgi:hypothetical protein